MLSSSDVAELLLEAVHPTSSSADPAAVQAVSDVLPGFRSFEIGLVQADWFFLAAETDNPLNGFKDGLFQGVLRASHSSDGVGAWAIKRQVVWIAEPFSCLRKSGSEAISAAVERFPIGQLA